MEKRYQVFVSSTFVDLQDARQEIMQALLELDCMPSGMELFPAADEDQWSLIKKLIDDSDYYVLVIAGRYGSIGPDGVSYTEMEYRYASEIGKPIISFIHSDPDTLPAKHSEKSEAGLQSLESFRSLVRTKLCRMWNTPADLGSQVSRSLVKLIKSRPAIGWVRADQVPSQSASEEMLKLRRKIEELETKLKSTNMSEPENASHLAKGDDEFPLSYDYYARSGTGQMRKTYKSSLISWDNLFGAIAPVMIDEATEGMIKESLDKVAFELHQEESINSSKSRDTSSTGFDAWMDDFHTIIIQLRALGLITKSLKGRSTKNTSTYWTLTPYGDNVMTRIRAIPAM